MTERNSFPTPLEAVTTSPTDILGQQREVLDKLRAWYQWDRTRDRSVLASFQRKIFSKRPSRPSEREVEGLAKYFFPPRGSVRASICDFGHGEEAHQRFKRLDVDITQILDHGAFAIPLELEEWAELDPSVTKSKPEWADVRWM